MTNFSSILRKSDHFWIRFLIPYGICFEVIVLYRSPPYQPSTIETTIYIVFLVLLLPHGVGEDHTVQLHPFGVWTLLQWPYFVAVLYGPWCWQQSNLQSRPIPTTIHHQRGPDEAHAIIRLLCCYCQWFQRKWHLSCETK